MFLFPGTTNSFPIFWKTKSKIMIYEQFGTRSAKCVGRPRE
jgi:hypothetical protein